MSAYAEPLWEVFVRPRRGLSHVHVGSLRAPDAEIAVLSARDLYTRRSEGVSIWAVRSTDIASSDPAEQGEFFETAATKPYRHASHYHVPDGLNL
jgi:ring-1,2-phenylacetyl-CoA epoxidase subunit PaaB